MNEMQELINTITSTQMPDNSYPVFCLLKIEDRCHVQFSWLHIEINAIGFDKDIVIFEAAALFTITVENFLDKAFKGG